MFFKLCIYFLLASVSFGAAAGPSTFSAAKAEMRAFVYHDQNDEGTLYCGCSWSWRGVSGGAVNLSSCGYRVRARSERAKRLEWEHVVPASNFGRARLCWQEGGRENCKAHDPVFNVMEADMHNLAPSIGEVNADRSNFSFGELPVSNAVYGECDFKVDPQLRVVEPRDEVKGLIARTYFYFHDRYNLRMSVHQQKLFMAWDKLYPVTEREREIHERVRRRMGHPNPFVTGEKRWTINHRNAAAGIADVQKIGASGGALPAIRANKRSGIYHLSAGCPGYPTISPRNVVEFASEIDAIAAGYRKARNCH